MNYPMLLTFDVEDWFQVENLKGAIDRKSWEKKEFRVIKNTERILKLLEKHNATATFFILGWIAKRAPRLVERIHSAGHEIACHGHNHQLVYDLTPEEFRADLKRNKELLETIIGDQIHGYRAPSFSITNWGLEILAEEGFVYDSSVFASSMHDRYSKVDLPIEKDGFVKQLENGLKEIDISTLKIVDKNIPWGGGGYFRLLPYWIYKLGYKLSYKQNKGVIFYFHPWELDDDQPRINNIKFSYKFRHYYGLDKAEQKLEKLIRDFDFMSIEEYLNL